MRPLDAVDRCKCEGVTRGFVKISCVKDGDKILGATIVGPMAGDLISEITVCMQNGIGVGSIAGVMHPCVARPVPPARASPLASGKLSAAPPRELASANPQVSDDGRSHPPVRRAVLANRQVADAGREQGTRYAHGGGGRRVEMS